MCHTLKAKQHNIYMSSHRKQPMSWDTHLLLGQSEWHAANKISERQVSEAVEEAARDSDHIWGHHMMHHNLWTRRLKQYSNLRTFLTKQVYIRCLEKIMNTDNNQNEQRYYTFWDKICSYVFFSYCLTLEVNDIQLVNCDLVRLMFLKHSARFNIL